MNRKEARIRLITKREELMHKYMVEEAEALTMAIEALQTDIVCCKECKHWKDYECHCESASTDHEGGASYSLDRDANDYCSFGERSEDE